MRYEIGLLVIATNRYIDFVPPLYESASRHFLRGHKVTMFVFTDRKAPAGVVTIAQAHRPWPYSTLLRYHTFVQHREALSQADYLYYCDADMRFVADVGEEILGDLVGTEHPGFYGKHRRAFTYERRKESEAFVGWNEGSRYFAGGFNGGRASRYLTMAAEIAEMIDKDLSKGIIAVWHDESYLNRYLMDHPPTIVLSPSYCYPQNAPWAPPLPPRVLALDKDHDALREVPYEEHAAPPPQRGMGRLLKRATRRSLRALATWAFPGAR
jgi:histo-blood group ABO system transferase